MIRIIQSRHFTMTDEKSIEEVFNELTERVKSKLAETEPNTNFNRYFADKLNEQDSNWRMWSEDHFVNSVIRIYANILGIGGNDDKPI